MSSPDPRPSHSPAPATARKEAYAPVLRGSAIPLARPVPAAAASVGELVEKSFAFRMALALVAGGLLAIQFAPKSLAERVLDNLPGRALPENVDVDQLIDQGNRALEKVLEEEGKAR